jgi:hypothetical protein
MDHMCCVFRPGELEAMDAIEGDRLERGYSRSRLICLICILLACTKYGGTEKANRRNFALVTGVNRAMDISIDNGADEDANGHPLERARRRF